jgi:hypothetical protein
MGDLLNELGRFFRRDAGYGLNLNLLSELVQHH